jgi:hypothetical protein
MSSERVLRNNASKAQVVVTNFDGTLTDADGDVVVTRFDGADDTISTDTLTTSVTKGVYEADVPERSDLDRLKFVWTATVDSQAWERTTWVDIVGGRLVSENRLRQDTELAQVEGVVLRRAIDETESWLEAALGYPPVVIGERITFNHPRAPRLRIPGVFYPRKLISVDREDDAVDIADAKIIDSGIHWPLSTGSEFLTGFGRGGRMWQAGRYDVWVEHGLEDPPGHLVRAAAVFARYLVRNSNYPERASQVSTEGALITFSIPSPDRPTGIPEVDAVILQERIDEPIGQRQIIV